MDLNIQHLDIHPPTGMVAMVTAPVDIPFQTQWASSLETLLCITGHVKLLFLRRKKKKKAVKFLQILQEASPGVY